jgi:hypothetical protein
MHCLLSVVSTLIDFGYMHVCDWASHVFLPMIPCKGCSLAKIQHYSLSSLIRVPHHHFTYDTVLRYTHCERPKALFGTRVFMGISGDNLHQILNPHSLLKICLVLEYCASLIPANPHFSLNFSVFFSISNTLSLL